MHMLNEQLLGYVRDNLRAGFRRPDIEASLHAAGWDALDVAAAFTAIGGGSPTAPAGAPHNATQRAVDSEVARLQTQFRATHGKQQAGGGGIIGWMIQKKLVSSQRQANMILIGFTVAFAALAIWIALR